VAIEEVCERVWRVERRSDVGVFPVIFPRIAESADVMGAKDKIKEGVSGRDEEAWPQGLKEHLSRSAAGGAGRDLEMAMLKK
jgi:hypothetical protein